MKNLIKNNWLSLVIVAIALGWGTSQLAILPDQMPTHFNSAGQADQFSSKYFSVYFLPLLSLCTTLFVSLLLKASPQKYSAEQSQSSIAKLMTAVTVFLMMLYFAMVKEATEPNQWMNRIMPVAVSLLILFMGNYFGKIEKNFVAGFRLPWTLASDENWKQTHRFAGKVFVIAGLISLAVSVLHPWFFVPIAALIAASIATTVFSYRYYAKHEST
ncbi:MAG: SdpI family protein [Pseudobdellovibrio sp.]